MYQQKWHGSNVIEVLMFCLSPFKWQDNYFALAFRMLFVLHKQTYRLDKAIQNYSQTPLIFKHGIREWFIMANQWRIHMFELWRIPHCMLFFLWLQLSHKLQNHVKCSSGQSTCVLAIQVYIHDRKTSLIKKVTAKHLVQGYNPSFAHLWPHEISINATSSDLEPVYTKK